MAERLLEGQVALVTGAGRGLGRAFAERLAALGCAIGVHGRREHGPAEYGEGTTLTATAEAIAAGFGVPTLAVLGDLTDGAVVERVVDTVGERLGPLGVPVASGIPAGHIESPVELPLGASATLDASTGTLRFHEAATFGPSAAR